MPRNFSRKTSANTGDTQIDVKNCDRRGRDAGNPRRLTQSRGTNEPQFILNFMRKARYAGKPKINRNHAALRILHALNLFRLLANITAVLDFSFHRCQHAVYGSLAQNLAHPRENLAYARLG